MNAVFVRDLAIMPRSDIIGSQFFRLFEKGPEFDFTIAQYVGIGRSARLVFGEKIGKDPVEILFGEIDRVVGNVEERTDAADVGIILFGRTASVSSSSSQFNI